MKIFKIINIVCLIGIASSLQPYSTSEPNKIKPRTNVNDSLPTNSWFQNWLLGNGEDPVKTYPYIVKAEKTGFIVCYPKVNTTSDLVFEQFQNDLTATVKELTSDILPYIDQSSASAIFSDLSATVKYGNVFDASVVRGYASVVFYFYSTTPIIKSSTEILNTAGSIETRELLIKLSNSQTWLIQSINPINWLISKSEIRSNYPYFGWIKVSIVIDKQSQNALSSRIDSLITNGRVSYDYDVTTITVTVSYNSPGLFYILPHALSDINSVMESCSLFFYSVSASTKGVKGIYNLASGNGYRYKIPVYSPIEANIAVNSKEKIDKLKEALEKDTDCLFSCTKVNSYVSAEEIARAARLIEIAALLNSTEQMNKIKEFLVNALDYWFGISNGESAFVYDPTWSGIVLRDGLNFSDAVGKYFAHHAFYGYFVNAFATLAKYYPNYYNSRTSYIEPLIADFAGTCLFKEFPCGPRNKDAFLGLSMNDGIGIVDKELQKLLLSPSLAISAYFGVRELGKALKNKILEMTGDILLSTEILAVKTYWQIKRPSDVYSSPFADNGVVGALWETKADYSTFFGANVEFIYGNFMIAFNEMSPVYLDRNWLSSTKPIWSQAISSSKVKEELKGVLLLADAIVDPLQSGLSDKIHSLQVFDKGNSKTNTLYLYYLLNGLPSNSSNTNITLLSVLKPGTTMSPSTKFTDASSTSFKTTTETSTDQQTKMVSNETNVKVPLKDISPDLVDIGTFDIMCGAGLWTCTDQQGVLVSCYNKTKYNCYIGGHLCPIDSLPCINFSEIKVLAPCYDPKTNICVGGELYLI